MIFCYSDGSSTGRSNREGGWAFVIVKDDKIVHQAFGGEPHTTNNLQEAEGAIQGLCWIINQKLEKEEITLVSDSQYVLGIGSGSYSPKKNLESAQLLRKLALYLKINFKWVKGHGKDPYNQLCDVLAKQGKELFTKKK